MKETDITGLPAGVLRIIRASAQSITLSAGRCAEIMATGAGDVETRLGSVLLEALLVLSSQPFHHCPAL